MSRPISILSLEPSLRRKLKAMTKSPKTSPREVRRARIILARADGKSQQQTADLFGVNRQVVSKWEKRFCQDGIAGLAEAPRPGRPRIADRPRSTPPPGVTSPPSGRTQKASRSMAKGKGVSLKTVQRPSHVNVFWNVIGLYLDPPERSLVLCCDEKSQCQALERSGTHDYIRHGTVSLFAALSYLDGNIFRQTAGRHTHKEWLAFIKLLEKRTPAGLALHLIVDNYATHKHPKVISWINWINQRHYKQHGVDRLVMHFTPASSSWMNLVEHFFRDLTVDCIRDGSFAGIGKLVQSIEVHLAQRDLDATRYVWKLEGKGILRKNQPHQRALATQTRKGMKNRS